MGQLSAYSNTFVAATKAKASEVNTNFTEIKTAHNATDAELPAYTNGNRVIASNNGKTAMVEITATTTEANYLSGVTSSIQTQLNDKPATSTVVLLDGTQKPTAVLEYASDLSGSMTAGSNKIPSIKWIETNYDTAFKEYGLGLTTGSDSAHDINITAGARWDSTYAAKINLAVGVTVAIDAVGALGLDAGSPANSTQYYVWLCSGSSGTTGIFSASSTSPTLPTGYDTYKVCIGRVITNGSADIDTTQFWTKNPDGTETYIYTQSTGDFPYTADISLAHNLGTLKVDIIAKAVKNSDSKETPLELQNGVYAQDCGRIDDTNNATLMKDERFITDDGTNNIDMYSYYASYRVKAIVKSYL
jgi:hypothetical protein